MGVFQKEAGEVMVGNDWERKKQDKQKRMEKEQKQRYETKHQKLLDQKQRNFPSL